MSDQGATAAAATGTEMNVAIGDHRVLHAGRQKWLGVLTIGGAFIAIGLLMIIMKGDFLAWFITAFFGLVASLAALQLTGKGSQLELNGQSFSIANFGRSTTQRWDEVANFKVYRTNYTEQVCYDRARDVETHHGEMNRSIHGRSACLPDTFGLSARQLADLMNSYQAHAVEQQWQGHADAVAAAKATIAGELSDKNLTADIITDQQVMQLPDAVQPWPAMLAVAQSPRPDGSRHVLIAVDILSPLSRWIPEVNKSEQAFDHLQADELRFVDPATGDTRSIMRDNQ